MANLKRARGPAVATLASLLLLGGCTGGTESNAATEEAPSRETAAVAGAPDPKEELNAIHTAIPIYHGAAYRDDLTRRDEVMARNRFGTDAKVYTLATNDSFPQVYHYYTTYLAQFRAFPARDTYPRQKPEWRTLELKLNDVMQDPFVPGDGLDPNGKQVTLQIAETEAEPRTVIRYIVTPAPAAPVASVATASTAAADAQLTR